MDKECEELAREVVAGWVEAAVAPIYLQSWREEELVLRVGLALAAMKARARHG